LSGLSNIAIQSGGRRLHQVFHDIKRGLSEGEEAERERGRGEGEKVRVRPAGSSYFFHLIR